MFFIKLPAYFRRSSPTRDKHLGKSVSHWWVLAGIILFAGYVSARNPIQIGGDEGMEMSKALLLTHQPEAAPAVWNDQSWLYSQLLAFTWQWGNGTWVLGRWLSVLALALLVGALWRLQGRHQRSLAKGMTLLTLIFWAPTLQLGCSMMLELPAFAAVTSGASLVLRGSRSARRPWIFGGAMIGLGIAIKLTALLYFPAILAGIVASAIKRPSQSPSLKTALDLQAVRGPLIWMAIGGLGTFAGLAMLSPSWDWAALWQSHWTASQMMPPDARTAYRFDPESLLSHLGILIAAGIGIKALLKQGEKRVVVFTLTALAVAALAHVWHQPFWQYYLLHFGIPIAALAGPGFARAYRHLIDTLFLLQRAAVSSTRDQAACMLYLAIPALIVSFEAPALLDYVNQLVRAQPAGQSQIVQLLRRHRSEIDTGYATNPTLLSHAGIPPEPEWTVLPLKRYWSKAVTKKEITAHVKAKRPDAIILAKATTKETKRWKSLLEADYTRAAVGKGNVLYLANHLDVDRTPGTKEMLERLGL